MYEKKEVTTVVRCVNGAVTLSVNWRNRITSRLVPEACIFALFMRTQLNVGMQIIHVEECPVCEGTALEQYQQVRDHSISGKDFYLVKCKDCQLVLTQDHPDEDAIGAFYESEDYISHSDTKSGLINGLYHRVRRHMLRSKGKFLQKISARKEGALLDYGCGTGYFLGYMRDQGWQTTGIEPDQGARTLVKRNFDIEVFAPEHLHALDNDAFHAITLWHVLEHVHDLNDTIAHFHRILKPGGSLIIAVPNYTSAEANHYDSAWAAYDVPRHLWHFHPNAMQALLKKHGFQLMAKKGMPFDAYYVSLLSEKYRKSKLGLPLGFLWGSLSNLQGALNTDRSSSIIYAFHKN